MTWDLGFITVQSTPSRIFPHLNLSFLSLTSLKLSDSQGTTCFRSMLSYDSKVEYDTTKFIPIRPLSMTVFNFLTRNALQLLHALYVIVLINLPISSALVSNVTQNASTGPWFIILFSLYIFLAL